MKEKYPESILKFPPKHWVKVVITHSAGNTGGGTDAGGRLGIRS